VSFIFNSWLKSYQSSCKHIAAPVYFEFQHKLIESILKRSTVLVAVNTTDEQQIYGYLVCEKIQDVTVLHYAYTKNLYRRTGIQKKLLAAANISLAEPCFISHKTVVCSKLASNSLVYNPYLAYGAQ
jgi:L-amino acid N-acyltransferase YncA